MIEYINSNKLIKQLVYVLLLSGILTLFVVCIFPFTGNAYRRALYRQWVLRKDKSYSLLYKGEVGAAMEPSESALSFARMLRYEPCIALSSHQLGIISELRKNYREAAYQYQAVVNTMGILLQLYMV